MRRFILQFSLFLALFLLLAGGLALVCLMVPATFLSDDDYNMALLDKLARLEETCGWPRRLVLIGGSNLAFSMDAARVEGETGMTTINMGLNAGMGLGYALQDVEPFIRNGDTLAIIPEYGNFSDWDGDFNRIAVTIDIEKKSARHLYRRGMFGWPDQFPDYVKWKSFNLFRGKTVFTDARLRRSDFNRHGDYIGHLDEPRRDFEVARAKDVEQINPAIFAALSNFMEVVRATRPDVSFLVSFPGFEARSFDNQREWIAAVRHELSRLDLEIISTPEDYRFDRGLFYDSAYHLNAEGRQLRTDRFIRDLTQWQAKQLNAGL